MCRRLLAWVEWLLTPPPVVARTTTGWRSMSKDEIRPPLFDSDALLALRR